MGEGELSGFVHYLKFERRYSLHTIEAYERDVEQFEAYLEIHYQIPAIAAATHFHVRSWLASLKEQSLTARSLNRKLSALSSFFVHLQKNGQVTNNPVRKLHAQRLPERLPAALRETETEQLLTGANYPDGFEGTTIRLICEVLYATAMRRSELMNLREDDIEWGRKLIRILGKGNKERLVPAEDALLNHMRAYLDEKKQLQICDNPYFFNLANGKPLYAVYINRVVKAHLQQVTTANKKTPHVLRHSFATHMLNNGANIQAIKDLLGHSSLAATQIYTHNDISRLKEIHKQSHPRG